MSARLLLHALLCSGRQEDCELLDKAHEAIKREVLREAAEKIRGHKGVLDGEVWRDYAAYVTGWGDGCNGAADLIDPDKES